MELLGSLLLTHVCFYSRMYYYQSCEHDGRPWYGRGWINKCDETDCKEGEIRGLLNNSSNVSIDYDKLMNN